METSLPNIATPPDDAVVWRYMDLGKFLALLSTSTLYLSRLDRLIDRYEGTLPHSTLSAAQKNWPDKNYQYFIRTLASMRAAHFVNCWCASPYESSVMWESYAKSSGVAIQTTVGALKSSIKRKYRYYLGSVEYLHFESAPPLELNLFSPVFKKRIEYQSEAEVRLLVSALGDDQNHPGLNGAREFVALPVDLQLLMKRIVVGPGVPNYVIGGMQNLLQRYGLEATQVQSSSL